MRLHRIRVEDVRGITAQEVTLADAGVTVVAAPNETGKSTLLEAVGLLLDYKHTSSAAAVRDIQPVGRDVSSLVEAELTVGAYHLVCRKQFNRERRAELEVLAPHPEQRSGDEAHDRLQQILDDHLDRALLRALWFDQGESTRQVALGRSRALGQALDHAAGAAGDPGIDDLFAAVREEHQRWFTPKAAKPQRHLTELDERVSACEREVADLSAQLSALQQDVDRSAEIDAELARLAERRGELEPHLAELQGQLGHIAELRDAEARERERLAMATERRDSAQATLDRRRELEQSVADGQEALDALDEQVTAQQAEVDRIDQRLDRLRAARDEADARARDARAAARRRREDLELVTAREQLAERRAVQRKVEEADAAARDAEAFLAGCALTDARLAAIDRAHEDLRVAEAQLEAGAPALTVEALEPVDVTVDDERHGLQAGDRQEVSVADPTTVTVGDVARVHVRPGASLGERTEARRAARARLDAACAEAGVSDRAEAHRIAEERRRAEEAVGRRDERVDELLGGSTRESLAQEIRDLEATVEGRAAARDDDAELPADVAAAAAARDAAETAADEAARAAEEAREAVEAAEPSLREARETLVARRTARTGAAEQLEQDRAALARARADQSDAALAAARDQHEQERRDAEAAHQRATAALADAQPDQVQLLADNAAGQLADLDQQQTALRHEQVAVHARLEAQGKEGLGERLAHAEAELARAREHRDREWRRAEAARLLHDVMAEERERAQAAYRQPLKEAIESLGRLVFDDTFAVEIGEDLAVARRTLGGVTVEWEQLSSGAKEQTAILSALACATLVDEGGAPLVLDDALGFTDPQRLERLGAVLSRAAGQAQVIVLTSTPDRYRAVAGATVCRLQPPGAARDGA